jgi:hypothetical protein
VFTARYEMNLLTIAQVNVSPACLSPRKSGFDSRSLSVSFVMDEVALGERFL